MPSFTETHECVEKLRNMFASKGNDHGPRFRKELFDERPCIAVQLDRQRQLRLRKSRSTDQNQTRRAQFPQQYTMRRFSAEDCNHCR